MDHISTISIAIFLLTLAAVFIFNSRVKQTSVKLVRGPPSPSILFGHERVLRNRSNFGELEMQWARRYGTVYRIGGCFAQDILIVSDPAALGYILSSSSSGNCFPKTKDSTFFIDLLLGQGLVAVEGETHRRQRKIINSAFSHSQLQKLQLRFQDSSDKLVSVIKDSLDTGVTVFNVLDWTGKVAMDIIGQTVFQHDFCSLDGKRNELRDALKTVFIDSQSNPSSLELMLMSLIRLLPDTILKFLKLVSTRETRHLSSVGDMAKRVARKAFSRRMGNDNEGDRDLVDVLGRALAAGQMEDDEVEAQLATFVIAGHETTATTLGWLLYELVAHPEDQNKIREEISQGRLQNGKLSSTEYDSMPLLNATIKEALRLHPIAHTLMRRTVQDECLPLSEPIITKDGKVLKYIPIPKGQTLLCSIYTYNRLPSIWGSDADQWNPNRFINDRAKPQAPLGMYANLMSFGSGTRSCIGWQFAIMEMQVILVDLLKHFEFSLPEGLNLQEFPAGPVIVPVVEGKASQGSQVPLRASFVDNGEA
ncbi:PAH-inducible cytochrome P450 monooxygenase PC-PAH 1 [Armillaria solidipes]|uniref:PAH-inducible cytochrome P450 monooxygenase PC-PAH 1 n=1 Tax=Armillaria solidipes TaxID=1076256 RepID=A0A2H3BH98_9AGAR|nr:PAH-inducible cytochrome P450 monooxygenase PC-PAH 1 [Armillaria solidipes]